MPVLEVVKLVLVPYVKYLVMLFILIVLLLRVREEEGEHGEKIYTVMLTKDRLVLAFLIVSSYILYKTLVLGESP